MGQVLILGSKQGPIAIRVEMAEMKSWDQKKSRSFVVSVDLPNLQSTLLMRHLVCLFSILSIVHESKVCLSSPHSDNE